MRRKHGRDRPSQLACRCDGDEVKKALAERVDESGRLGREGGQTHVPSDPAFKHDTRWRASARLTTLAI